MNRIFGCFVAFGLLIGCMGCISQTVAGVGRVRLGLRSEAHEFRGLVPKVERNGDMLCTTFGNVTVCSIVGLSNDNTPLVTFNSVTGPTTVVEPSVTE